MLNLLLLIAAFFAARLLWRAFQGSCEKRGISEYRGAWVLFKILTIIGITGFVGLVFLAYYLDAVSRR